MTECYLMMPAFFDVYLCFGVISVLHWTVVAAWRVLGTVPRGMPH